MAIEKITFNIDEIRKYIPHSYPFLLIDRVIEIDKGVSCRGIKNVTVNEPFFTGHFSSYPVMPGVLLIEAMAQLSGCLEFLSSDNPKPNQLPLLVGVDNAKFKAQVRPGDQLIISARYLARKSIMAKFDCEVHIRNMDNSETFACSCETKTMMVESSKLLNQD